MSAHHEVTHDIADYCKNLARWRVRAAEESWQPELERLITAIRQEGGSPTEALLQVEEARAVISLRELLPVLQQEADAGGWRPALDEAVENFRSGGSAAAVLRELSQGLSDKARTPGSAGTGRLWPDNATESEFRCPRADEPCSRREVRGKGQRWPTCHMQRDKPMKPRPFGSPA